MQENKLPKKINYKFLILSVIVFVLIAGTFIYSARLNASMEGIRAKNINIEGSVNAISISENGEIVYTGLREEKIVASDISGNVIWEYKVENAVLDIDNSGNYIFASSDSRKIYILSKDGSLVNEFSVGFRPMTISGDEDGNVFISSTMTAVRNRLQYFNISGEEIFSFEPDTVTVNTFILPQENSVVYLHRGARIVKLDSTGTQTASSSLQYTPREGFYSPDAGFIAVIDEGDFVYLFNEDLEFLWRRNLPARANSITIDRETDSIIAGMNNGQLRIYDYEGNVTGDIRTSFNEMRNIIVSESNGEILILARNNTVAHYNARDLNNYARSMKIADIIIFIQIIFALALVLLVIHIFPVFSKKFRESIGRFFKSLFKYKKTYLFILPTFILLAIFNYYPAISSFVIAFADYIPGAHFRWVGLSNFISIVQNTYFWTGIMNMIIFLVTDVLKFLIPPIIIAELILALRSKRGQYWTRVGLYLPVILPSVAGLLVWTDGMLGINGAINGILRFIGLGNLATSWLGNTETALWALVFIGFPWAGTFFIIFYGALIGVPSSLFEAAKIDGCSWWKRIIKIDVPMISPQIKYVFVVGFIMSIQDFQRVYVTTMGGPQNATYTPMLELFFTMTKFNNYGEAAAMGLIMFAVIFGATLINLRMKTTQM